MSSIASASKGKIAIILVILVVAVGATMLAYFSSSSSAGINHEDPALVSAGSEIYQSQCASCHGADLEGQPNWREPLVTGGFAAPPHDETGHTWHHPDQMLFDYTKQGGQALMGDSGQSNMPAFADILSDREIWAVLSYIKSTWPQRVQDMHSERN